jgi:uncharacterized lipoprotein YddW (UPF0748 family)
MKIYFLILIIFLGYFPIIPQEKTELRGVWLTDVDSNVLSSDQNISDAMDYLASMGINVVFPVVYSEGYTLYPSKIMDSLFNAPVLPNSPFVNRDFLQRLIIEAHRNGIEVIPWFEYGFATSYNQNGGHIIAKFPLWALKDSTGKLVTDNGFDWMSAINPDAQNFMISLVMEVIDNYDVDGVQGDDRFPAMPVEGGYDSVTVSIYKSEHSGQRPPNNYFDASWMQWRANKLTQFLARLRDSVKSRGKNIILSCAPAPYYWGFQKLLQDSKSWVRNGLVDNIIPQLYQYNINDYNYALNTTWNDIGILNPNIFTSGVLLKIGSFVVGTNFLNKILDADRAKGINNECYFFYEGLKANYDSVGTFLKNNFYQKNALLPYRNGNSYRPKAQVQDTATIMVGNWSNYIRYRRQIMGYDRPVIHTSDTAKYADVVYNFNINSSAFYDVYSYRTPDTLWTKNALYTLYSDNDSAKVTIDQSDLTSKGWSQIGTVYLSTGYHSVLKLDNSKLESGKYLVTDAVMLLVNRKLSPDVISAVKNGRVNYQPLNFEISNNFPNPFNPSTNIKFSLAQAGNLSLRIYNVMGQLVKTIVDNVYKNKGNYEFNVSMDNFASGIYFYTLIEGNRQITKKMVLMK